MWRGIAGCVSISVVAVGWCTGCFAPLLGAASGATASTAGGSVVSGVVANPSLLDVRARSTQIGFLSPAALLAENPSLEGYIISEQCYFRTPDPLFLVPDEDRQINWMFAGRLNQDHNFNAVEYRNILTLGLMQGAVQLSAWPVQLVALSDMPQVFLQDRLPLLPQAKMSSDDTRELEQTYLRQEQRIENVVARLEESYNPLTSCAGGESR
jgi:hypothetical protein